METWVLIIWMTALYKGGAVAVPGYTTKQQCMEAGAAADARQVKVHFCIPGPAR